MNTIAPLDSGLSAERNRLESRYRSGRLNLWLAIGFTVMNTLLLLLKTDMYFLFSIEVPYFFLLMGLEFSGNLAGMTEEEIAAAKSTGAGPALLTVAVAVMVLILAYYVICAVFSNKYRGGWLVAAAVGVGLDTLFLVGVLILFADLGAIFNLIFHVWLLVLLILGASSCRKIKKERKAEAERVISVDDFPAEETDFPAVEAEEQNPDSETQTPESDVQVPEPEMQAQETEMQGPEEENRTPDATDD